MVNLDGDFLSLNFFLLNSNLNPNFFSCVLSSATTSLFSSSPFFFFLLLFFIASLGLTRFSQTRGKFSSGQAFSLGRICVFFVFSLFFLLFFVFLTFVLFFFNFYLFLWYFLFFYILYVEYFNDI